MSKRHQGAAQYDKGKVAKCDSLTILIEAVVKTSNIKFLQPAVNLNFDSMLLAAGR